MAAVTKRNLCLTEEHVRRFAEASGDRNPLHVDPLFARRTPYGRCICHGALVTIAALGAVDTQVLAHAVELEVQFKQPVFPGDPCTVVLPQADRARARIEVASAGRMALALTLTADPGRPRPPATPARQPVPRRTRPRRRSVDQLSPGTRISESYGCRMQLLRALAADLGARAVPDSVLTWLSAASFVVGMLVPGRDAVFVGARILTAATNRSGRLTASVTTADDRTGLVITEAVLAQGDASARMTLQAFLRPAIPAPDRSSIGRYLPASNALTGRRILVVGASRGLGAALCGAFAMQGATVWTTFARSAAQARELRREFGAERIHLLRFDAQDLGGCRRGFDRLRRQAGAVDGVILCAAPTPYATALHPDASEATLRFLSSSMAMTIAPLAEALALLSPGGWLVLASSSALDDLPEARPHEVIAKASLEGAAAYCARHTHARVLVVRPPRMWTDATNTPMGRLGAVPSEQVAAAVVRWAIRAQTPDAAGTQASLLAPEDLVE